MGRALERWLFTVECEIASFNQVAGSQARSGLCSNGLPANEVGTSTGQSIVNTSIRHTHPL